MDELNLCGEHRSITCVDLPQTQVSAEELGLGDALKKRHDRIAHQYVAVRLAALPTLAQLKSAPAVVLALAVIQNDKLEGKPLRFSQDRAKASKLSRWQWGRAVKHLPVEYFSFANAPGKATAVGLTDEGRRLFHKPSAPK